MTRRHTIQCALVLEAVNKLRSHATADEIYAELAKEHPSISRATVYRNLQRLCESGKICRREIPGGADRFDHFCHHHYHVRCTSCGRVFDVDMDYNEDLEKSVKDTHGFLLTGHDIVFKGICPDCRKDSSGESGGSVFSGEPTGLDNP
jgi:Fur family ferric uptake transcriptional regulator/Fur family peroxide stress response transcriptional regulator